MTRRFTIPGPPFGKKAPNFKGGRFAGGYPNSDNVAYASKVLFMYSDRWGGSPALGGQVAVSVDIYFAVPMSYPAWKQAAALGGKFRLRPTKKPDVDNCQKAILDPLNGVAFKDDAQVVAISVAKRFAIDPYIDVEIREIGPSLKCTKAEFEAWQKNQTGADNGPRHPERMRSDSSSTNE